MYFIILPIYSCKVRDFSRHVIQRSEDVLLSEAKNPEYIHVYVTEILRRKAPLDDNYKQ